MFKSIWHMFRMSSETITMVMAIINSLARAGVERAVVVEGKSTNAAALSELDNDSSKANASSLSTPAHPSSVISLQLLSIPSHNSSAVGFISPRISLIFV